MKCPACGNENKKGTKFCTQCGYKFEEKSDDKMSIYGQKAKENFRVANRGYDLDREYDFDEEDEVREKKGLGIIKTTAIFIVVFLVIGAAGIFAWNSGILSALTGSSNNHYSKNLKKNSDSKNEKSNEAEGTTIDDWAALENQDATESDNTTESVVPTTATTEATQGTTAVSDAQVNNQGNMTGSTEITLTGVSESNVPDYNNYLSPDNYEKLTVDTDFSFSYPSGFFSKVEQYNKNYTFSTSDNSDTMYISCESGSGDAVKDVKDAANKNASLINANEDKHGVKVVSDKVKDGWAHCIIGGNYTDGQNGNGNGMYKVIVSNGSSIYTLDYEYSSSDTSTYYTAQNYMLDCIYRYCEHSGTTYKPRTWDDFNHDRMGEKKNGSDATVQNSTNTTAKSSSAKEYTDNNKKAFYGVWAQASQDLSKAKKYKADLEAKGWKCSIFLTSEWKNLNKEDWYAISVGIYSSKTEAENNLKNIQADYADAYVKYSGDYCN